MPQLSYPLTGNPGQPGQLFDNERHNADIVQAIAGVVIPPGVFVEFVLVSGAYLAFPLKDSGTGGTFLPELIGVSMIDVGDAEQAYQTYTVPNAGTGSSFAGYPVGKAFPVVRRGRVWTQWDGNTGVALPLAIGAMQVWHSSTGANPQGVVTTKAAQITVGAEIDALPTACQLYDPRNFSGTYVDAFGTTTSMVVMALNLPGK